MTVPGLLTAHNCVDHVHLIIGCGPLAASRCSRSLQVGAKPVLIAPASEELHYTLVTAIEDGRISWLQREFEDQDLNTLGREEIGYYVDAVFVTLSPGNPQSIRISDLCKRQRVPVNVVDAPNLCTFTLLSTHLDGPLQIGITTSGSGCKLSSRIRRELVSALPSNFGQAVERLGSLRRQIWEQDLKLQHENSVEVEAETEDEESAAQKHTFNNLVRENDCDPAVLRTRRMRWLSQICEYWPLSRLASITDADISAILEAYRSTAQPFSPSPQNDGPTLVLSKPTRTGSITLAGSGPGHPSLLTLATHSAIQTAHYILADKLVPAEILALIPRRTPVHIARKFPGNADAAQEELLELGMRAMEQGKDVLRLKQGDPYLYGRGAEEVTFFRDRGYEVRVIPGITSALSAPMFAGIPVTHRSVADQVVICTGTGRKGAAPEPPSYRKTKTVVFLMALHRLDSLVASLTMDVQGEGQAGSCKRALWPRETPCSVIERASCPDQRVIRSTLQHVCQAVQEEGSRPPGLLVVGNSCEVLERLTADQRWKVQDGFRGIDAIGTPAGELDMLKELESLSHKTERVDGDAVVLERA